MSDGGYTMVEMLAALMILALVTLGLSAAIQVMGRGQAAVVGLAGQSEALRRAQATLDQLFEGRGPFLSSQPRALTGSATSLDFDCGNGLRCSAQLASSPGGAVALQVSQGGGVRSLTLASGKPAHFVYRTTAGDLAAWPPAAEPRQRLSGVAVVADAADTHDVLLESHLWLQEAKVCQFDVVLQDCR